MPVCELDYVFEIMKKHGSYELRTDKFTLLRDKEKQIVVGGKPKEQKFKGINDPYGMS